MNDYVPKVYLAGPVQHADDGGSDWREGLIERFSDQFEFLNPLDKYDTQVENVVWLQPGEVIEDYPDDVEVVDPEKVVADDKAMIDEADYVLVGLREIVPMYGTPREHEYAYQTNTPVVVWHQEGVELPIWAIADSQFLSYRIESCMEHIYVDNTRDAIETDVVNTLMENI